MFRVTPQQLQAHSGQVRCGRCMAVFDGFSTLAALPEQDLPQVSPGPVAHGVVAEPDIHAPQEREASVDTAAQESKEAPLPPPDTAAHATMASAAAQQAIVDASPAVHELRHASPAGSSAPASAASVAQESAGVPREPDAVEEAAPARTHRSRAWSVGAGCLAALLVGQAAYAYRVDLAANYPGLKPVFAGICSALGCSVPLPQRPKLINIEASDLQMQDPAQPSVIQLTATLRNHAGYEVGYPALDLVLTNTKEHTLARRIFMPEEYLEGDRGVAAGLAANAEFTVRLLLDTGGLGAAGFRLALLPAHPR
jgi:predicted Zn finger-like uncharacterized protein